MMSPYSVVFGYSGRPFRDRGLTPVVPVVAAGRVALPRKLSIDPNSQLRLLHVGTYLEGAFPRWEISRRRLASEIGDTSTKILELESVLVGPQAPDAGAWANAFLTAPGIHLAGGTDEIMKNIIGERVLGLPRDPTGG